MPKLVAAGLKKEEFDAHVENSWKPPPEKAAPPNSKEMSLKLPMLPCWDESDDGVPPFCRGPAPVSWWKVFNSKNRFTNDNLVMITFGNVGFGYFDKKRKFWMGAAMWSTLLGIGFTVYGCFALSTNVDIVRWTYWVHVVTHDTSTNDRFISYLGLRSLTWEHGPCDPTRCELRSFPYGDSSVDYPNEFLNNGLGTCRTQAYGTAFGAFTTCATLLFALSGTMNRMKFSADANIQKALGMITDLCGFISLLSTLINFGQACNAGISTDYTDSTGTQFTSKVYLGPGYVCYVICLFGAMMRAVFHWLTPVPDHGSGCTPRVPQYLLDLLDEDKDGQISWSEMKQGYAKLRRNFNHQEEETGHRSVARELHLREKQKQAASAENPLATQPGKAEP